MEQYRAEDCDNQSLEEHQYLVVVQHRQGKERKNYGGNAALDGGGV